MAFKLAVSNKILTRVKGVVSEEGSDRAFDFQLEQDRVTQDELQKAITNRGEDAAAFIKRVTHGWRDQRLVLTDDDKPAAFSAEALDVLLTISGMAGYCWQAYLAQVLVHEKN